MLSNKELIAKLISDRVLHKKDVINAFVECDRILFVPEQYHDEAYYDQPLPIGYGQTISQPTTVAFMLELLDLTPGLHVLDIGSGSGWTTSLISHIIGQNGAVTGMEIIPELVEFGLKNIHKLSTQNARIIYSKSSELGTPGQQYDRILVSASASELPYQLVDQLNINGVLVIPIKDSIYKIIKQSNGNLVKQQYYGFRFVPLVY